MAEKMKTWQDYEAAIIKKAWEDDKFRQELIANPKAAMERVFNIKFPDNMKLEVHEESPTVKHLVLPVKPGFHSNQKLSDNDLEAVTGGTIFLQTLFKCVPIIDS